MLYAELKIPVGKLKMTTPSNLHISKMATKLKKKHPKSHLPNSLMLNRWFNMRNNCPRKRTKKIRECHAIAYGFLRLLYKYKLRRYTHYVIFTFA